METKTKSKRFEQLKAKFDAEYITTVTLAGYVMLNEKAPGRGITPEEFEEITGEEYGSYVNGGID